MKFWKISMICFFVFMQVFSLCLECERPSGSKDKYSKALLYSKINQGVALIDYRHVV
jgi:hypothetical protein